MGTGINIQIVSATGVGGKYPFVVVCFDGDVSNELYKTDATTGGRQAMWDHAHTLDLSANVKARVAAGHQEPTYLTFFLFDTGAEGIPPLGSAGVLLQTVKDDGRAQGDFPVVNGNGTLRLVVQSSDYEGGGLLPDESQGMMDRIKENKTKIAAGVGASALAAGLAAVAVHENKKKKKKNGGDSSSDDGKKKSSLFSKLKPGGGSSSSEDGGVREVVGESSSSASEGEGEGEGEGEDEGEGEEERRGFFGFGRRRREDSREQGEERGEPEEEEEEDE